jgi:hypothetical protein
MKASPDDRSGGPPDRDQAMHTRADRLGLLLTALAILFARFLHDEWLLLPAGYWVMVLSLRLVSPGGRRRVGAARR